MSCAMDIHLGAYLLDALEPAEIAAVSEHLARCAQCQEDLAELSWIPQVLGRARLEDVELAAPEPGADSSVTPSSVMLERLIASAQRRRRTRNRHRCTAVVAGAAVVTAGAATTALTAQSVPKHAAAVHAVDPHTRVDAAVTVTARSWGSQLDLRLTGAYPGGRCLLVAHSKDGRSDTAATWVASGDGAAEVPGATSIPADKLAELDVVTASGQQLVSLVMPD